MSPAKHTLRRVFVVVWVVLALAGALNHTIAMKAVGRRFDLGLPHLRYGYVMFNRHLRTIRVYRYSRGDGAQRDLAELMPTRSIGYQRARLGISVLFQPRYLRELCFRSLRAMDDEITFHVDEYQVDVDPHHPVRSAALRCSVHGLRPR